MKKELNLIFRTKIVLAVVTMLEWGSMIHCEPLQRCVTADSR